MKKLPFLSLCLAIAFASCSRKESPVPKPDTANAIQTISGRMIIAKDSNLVDSSLAAYLASYYNSNVFFGRSKSSTQRDVSSAYSIPDKNGDPALYVFNYNQGYLIVSADFRYQPVLLFSEQGNLQKGDELPSMFDSWIGRMVENVELLRDFKYDNTAIGYHEWNALMDGNHVPPLPDWYLMPDDPTNSGPYGGGGCSSINTVVGPLMQTAWDQGCGYNNLLSTCSSGGNCGRVPTGCVATAMGQILRYWSDPDNVYSLNYAAMTPTSGSTETQRLMQILGQSNILNMDYDCDASSANDDRIRTRLLSGLFNYTTAENEDYDNDGDDDLLKVVNDLNHGKPVVLGGYRNDWFWGIGYSNGHSWVCDGYRLWGTNCAPEYYYHMNWGWGGTGNTWCYVDFWIPTGINRNYQYAQNFIHNIHP